MSAAKSTLSEDVRHRMLPPWGLYFFKFPVPFPHHPHFCDHVNHDDATPSRGIAHQWQGHAREKVQERLPRRGYTVDRAGLMSAAKSTLSDDVCHRMLPPWGLYFFKIPMPFPH